ncbi:MULTISPECIES: hypothetical protein [Bacillaceae]|uniref:Uncharacterized protein YdzL n=3 Tax=Bacillus subtilis subsp. subtilis TaxID=135461 RepID=YDZL_BACSU|nr:MULTISPECIES: hypothetical protein [Bacillales]YP_003097681.1 ICEBs1 mobile element: conserved protein of unknown function [Bacillus subtilis subsp. subtilis str. 168]C0H3V5.1 RecName: Full=Uncharacterized protein YdzL [Bacillus subtilis subsp. subtilis str. 168]AGG59832.1 YdzL [Bacillus subtilis subsp. subtilis 6051-HGW]AIC38854.1 hypothetical protein BSUA_00534 [Bacillus subtilis subsp. subtilis str. JH642 substr. AG174]AIC43086.1 ydzL [Bacillus subtilis subsp. subtilis str. AG1839]AQR80
MIFINIDITNSFMKEAVPLARQMEGDWIARMKIALNSVIINHYLNLPLTIENVNELLRKGVSYRRICKHYGIGRKDIEKLRQSSVV